MIIQNPKVALALGTFLGLMLFSAVSAAKPSIQILQAAFNSEKARGELLVSVPRDLAPHEGVHYKAYERRTDWLGNKPDLISTIDESNATTDHSTAMTVALSPYGLTEEQLVSIKQTLCPLAKSSLIGLVELRSPILASGIVQSYINDGGEMCSRIYEIRPGMPLQTKLHYVVHNAVKNRQIEGISPEISKGLPPLRKWILLVTAHWDSGGSTDDTLILDPAQSNLIPIYVWYWEDPPIHKEELERIALGTGGRLYDASQVELPGDYLAAAVGEHLRTQLIMSYPSQAVNDRHDYQVRVVAQLGTNEYSSEPKNLVFPAESQLNAPTWLHLLVGLTLIGGGVGSILVLTGLLRLKSG